MPAEMGPREYFNNLGVKLWCRMLGVQDKCRKYNFAGCLGNLTRPAIALEGRFPGCPFARKMLQAKAHAPSKPSLLK
jgi:hypothetical protein